MGLFSKPEIIILKESNDAKNYLSKLEALLLNAPENIQDQIQKEIAITKAGITGEENILFELKHSNTDMIILHDIYIETSNGLSAQIDFLLVTAKNIFVIECKNLVGNIDIHSDGSFVRTITYGHKRQKEGIYSPITQSERHLTVLKEAISENTNWLKGIILKHNFDTFYKPLIVLANPKTVVNDRYAKKEIKKQVIRADQLNATIKNMNSQLKELPLTKKEMLDLAQRLLNRNIDARKDYALKYEELLKSSQLYNSHEPKQTEPSSDLVCPKCGSKLVLRTAQKGPNTGKQFYGCSSFPQCRFILNIK